MLNIYISLLCLTPVETHLWHSVESNIHCIIREHVGDVMNKNIPWESWKNLEKYKIVSQFWELFGNFKWSYKHCLCPRSFIVTW